MKYLSIFKNNMHTFFASVFLFMLQVNAYTYAAVEKTNQKSGVQIGNLGKKNFQQIITDFILVASKYTITLLIGLTIMVFLYGLMKYMYKGQASDTARTEGRKLMLWGIIGIFVMTSVWGLVSILASIIGHNGVVIPQFR